MGSDAMGSDAMSSDAMGSETISVEALLGAGGPLLGRVESRVALRPDGLIERRVCWSHAAGREVLLRVMPFLLDTAGRERLTALHRFDHPKIVPLLDWGEHDGSTWILTDWIRGPRIADTLLRDGAVLALEELVPIIAQVLTAVGHAHDRGFIVGPITARDVHQTEQGGRALAIKIADFGLAALKTRTGVMAVVDTPADDVREIGLLMHELMHGARDAPALRDDLPAALVALHADMLDPNADSRPADGNAVVERLIDAVHRALFELPSARGTGRSDDSKALSRFAVTTQRIMPAPLPTPVLEPTAPASTGSMAVITTGLESAPRRPWIAVVSVVALAVIVALQFRGDQAPSGTTETRPPLPRPEQADAVVASPIAPDPGPPPTPRDEPRRDPPDLSPPGSEHLQRYPDSPFSPVSAGATINQPRSDGP